MMQGQTILWTCCQPTLHCALLAGVELVRRYKNDRNGLMSHWSFRLIYRKVRRSEPEHRAMARICGASTSGVSHPIAIGR